MHNRKIRRYQHTVIDNATRIRALTTCERRSQDSAIDFIDYVIGRFSFLVNTIRRDNGHESQAKLHWHVEDLETQHVDIRRRNPDLREKLAMPEAFYNALRPHPGTRELTPDEVLRNEAGIVSASTGVEPPQ